MEHSKNEQPESDWILFDIGNLSQPRYCRMSLKPISLSACLIQCVKCFPLQHDSFFFFFFFFFFSSSSPTTQPDLKRKVFLYSVALIPYRTIFKAAPSSLSIQRQTTTMPPPHPPRRLKIELGRLWRLGSGDGL